MKQKLLYPVTIVFVVALSFITYETTQENDQKPQIAKSAKEEKIKQEVSGKAFVLDGDSLKVKGQNIRLIKIDAPEYKQQCYDAKKTLYPCGKISRDFLLKLAGGKKVTCLYDKKDIYKRLLAECFINDKSINDTILENGMAVIYSFNNVDNKTINLEKLAKNKKIGIWQGPFEMPKDYRKKNRRKKNKSK